MAFERTKNPDLVDYGIHNEASDIRIHVARLAKKLYIFRTVYGLAAIDLGNYRIGYVRRNGGIVGEGYLVPPGDIMFISEVSIPDHVLEKYPLHAKQGQESEKGEQGEKIVQDMSDLGILIGPLIYDREKSVKVQISGIDGRGRANLAIQVKYDEQAGKGHDDCTGNLFLQRAERNPEGKH